MVSVSQLYVERETPSPSTLIYLTNYGSIVIGLDADRVIKIDFVPPRFLILQNLCEEELPLRALLLSGGLIPRLLRVVLTIELDMLQPKLVPFVEAGHGVWNPAEAMPPANPAAPALASATEPAKIPAPITEQHKP
ncbi:hypothetical protein C5167_031288 [Papaver somniferum]|nr:hypothetical protein C5167_031288 [Papaver somniferum]